MIIQKDMLQKMKDFGLNSYEAKLWTALLSRGVSTAGELSDIANVPRSRTYDVLETLEKKGFIVMKLGKPIKYLAVHPNEVVKRIKKQVMVDAHTHVKILDELDSSSILQELELL
ncbi:MAG: TrmB family transcriptional regulator, partial [Candidatus Woesearchaeota archaeon]